MSFLSRLLSYISLVFLVQTFMGAGCKKTALLRQTKEPTIAWWVTTGDQSRLLQRQAGFVWLGSQTNSTRIVVDTTQTFQTIDGFGYTLTGGSAQLINRLSAEEKGSLLRELFSPDSIGVSYLRISIGASDLDAKPFSYNDLPNGTTDVNLTHFNLSADKTHLIPLLKEILRTNPAIKIMASPWSAPTWMKDNNSTIGGSLKPEYYAVYAQYFVKYIQQMKATGITIDAITPQNEPLHPGNNPSMYMTAAQQTDFIKNHLGPSFKMAGIETKIIIYDHNADRPDYPLTVLSDSVARQFITGSAFHLYAGDVAALSQVHNAHPDKHIYFTEQWTGAKGSFDGDLKWHIKNVIIGSLRNWSRVALEWNLANDPSFGPHTAGGCTECRGALTIGPSVTRNVSYYIIAHAAKFVPPGSVRIGSNNMGKIHTVAFRTPAGNKVLIALNEATEPLTFDISFAGKWAGTTMPGGAVASYVWQ